MEIADTPIDQLPPLIHVPPLTKPFDVTIRPPGSKSLTNRALLLAALAEGTSTLKHALVDADDAQVMLRAIQQLGAKVEQPDAETLKITGVAGRWKIPAGHTVTLNLNNAGTATRFLTAAAILAPPESEGIIIDGNARMRERPIGELVDVLRAIGVAIEYRGRDGFPPISVRSATGRVANEVAFGKTVSSQFVSALILIGPFLSSGLRMRLGAELTSLPYVQMSYGLMPRLTWDGVDVLLQDGSERGPRRVDIRGGGRAAFQYEVESDATAATYFLVGAGLCWSSVCIEGLPLPSLSLQGDSQFGKQMELVGGSIEAEQWSSVLGPPRIGIQADLRDMPDTAMSAAVLAAFVEPNEEERERRSWIGGLKTLRVKETDRIAALVTELAKVGVKVEPFIDGDDEAIRITPPPGGIDCSPSAPRVEFDTYDDHRMAMSLALIGLRRPNVYIRDPACVRKTYPTYWRDLAKLYT